MDVTSSLAPSMSDGAFGAFPAVSDHEEEDWIRGAALGDRTSFAHIYRRYSSMVHGILISRVSSQEARDLCQDVFVSALRALRGGTRPEHLGGWLATIARNGARNAYRSRGFEDLADHPEPISGDGAGVEGGLEEDEEARRVLDALRGLPVAYRETLTLRLVEGLGGPEIAARTGLTHGSVRVNLHRGMKLLRERLEGQGS